ncbi:teratocarcinoma-derived growth factor 1 isoform X2 [Etheostoma cragini]|uniref:teratocarcinoma-derived growth factor 1 isoform X2 n=1 Tax=Etheostoma cragini TaxID=417921 RepID=UPI00155E73D1|nr:teratocarcinoma-derived growth factor 1 isoform X2 [Etheostoma cragini]
MSWIQLLRIVLCAATCLRCAAALPAAGCEGDGCTRGQTSLSPALSSSSSVLVKPQQPSQDFLGQFTQVLSRVVAAVRTEEPVSLAASVPALHSSPGGAASTTSASGAAVRFLTASGFRKDAPTVAVVTASCTASPTSSTTTVMTRRRCVGIDRPPSGQSGRAVSCF